MPDSNKSVPIQRAVRETNIPLSSGHILQLQSKIGNSAIVQLMNAQTRVGKRKMLSEPQDIPLQAKPTANFTSQIPIQMVRAEMPYVFSGDTVTPQQLMDYLGQIDEQITSLDETETARTDKIDQWRQRFIDMHSHLITEITNQGNNAPSFYSEEVDKIKLRDTTIRNYFYSAAIALNNMRGELNTSLQAYNSMMENQRELDAYKKQRQQASYAEPQRAGLITEWDKNFAYLYRRMSVDEYKKIGSGKKKLEQVTATDNSRKWLSTSSSHSFAFSNENVTQSGSDVTEMIVRLKVDRKKLTSILKKLFPAYKTDSYKPKNKDKVLIHQELLAQGKNANTSTTEELELIFANNEHFNLGFSSETIKLLDDAIVEITTMSVQ